MKNTNDDEAHDLRRTVSYVTQNLEAAYGIPRPEHHPDVLDELVGTILSQSTSDVNSRRAFENLKRRFPEWESVRKARPATIADAIRSGGLANTKSVVIKNVLNEIKKRRGDLDLQFLKTAEIDRALEFLTSLKGIGPKTAACVLLFSANRPVFPMDTHIFRIARRIGLLPDRINDNQAHVLMDSLVPRGKHLSLHINLIRHGRLICKPQNPKCLDCCLVEHCDYGRNLI